MKKVKSKLSNPRTLKSVINSTSDTIWDLNIETNDYFVKFRDNELYGFLPNMEITDRVIWEKLIHPEDRDMAIKYLKNFLKGESGDIYKNVYRIMIKDNQYRWILSRGKAWRDSKGNIIRISGNHIDITENYELKKRIENLAYFDQITGFPNMENAKLFFDSESKSKEEIHFIYIELDNYKNLSILWSKQVIDDILIKISNIISKVFLEQHVSKISESSFLVLSTMTNQSNHENMVMLKKSFEEKFLESNNELNISFTAGLSKYKFDGNNFEELLKKAQIAFQTTPNRESNEYAVFDLEMAEKFRNGIYLTKEIKKAIENKEFEMYYQPIIDTKSGLLTGLEALIRWNHKEKGFISPTDFIKVAESSGQMINLELTILENIFSQIGKWSLSKDLPLFISINLSAKGLLEGDLKKALVYLTEKYEISTKKVEFEITESYLIKQFDRISEVINEVKKMGFKVSLDDFGIEYSSLNYFKLLPIDKLKIDKSFIEQIGINAKDKTLLKHIIQLGHEFGLKIVGEGVETLEQVKTLKELKCDYIQGYYYGKPMSAGNISLWIKENYIRYYK